MTAGEEEDQSAIHHFDVDDVEAASGSDEEESDEEDRMSDGDESGELLKHIHTCHMVTY